MDKRFIISIVAVACFVATSLLMPSAGTAQTEKIKAAMADLRAETAKLGAPKIEGTATVAGKNVPELYFGSTKMDNNFKVVDAVAKKNGGTATLLVKAGDEYVRVATDVKKVDGSRATGTVLDPNGPVITMINKGDAYYGEANILGKRYVTGYEPIKDESGNVIGIYYVGYAAQQERPSRAQAPQENPTFWSPETVESPVAEAPPRAEESPMPQPTPTPTAAPAAPEDYRQLVTLLYATNRIVNPSTNELLPTQVSDLRDPHIGFGSATVRIPEAHKFGHVEQPEEIRFLGYSLWREGLDEKKHFVIRDLHATSEEDFIKKVKADGDGGILVYVHGFNTDFKSAIFNLAQIVFDSNFHGLPIAFIWPSRGGILNYDRDREMALASRAAFREMLKLLYANADVKKIYVIAHSMGNQIVVDSLYQESLTADNVSLSELVMAAPDVDLDVFSSMVAGIKKVAKGITIYASGSDKALQLSKLKAGGVRLGDVPDTGPVVFAGIDTIDVTALGANVFELNHRLFSSSRSVMDDLGRVLRDIRPPGSRTPELRGLPPGSDPPHYWQYPPPRS
jgi:esterase/lipase superfamily enzyme